MIFILKNLKNNLLILMILIFRLYEFYLDGSFFFEQRFLGQKTPWPYRNSTHFCHPPGTLENAKHEASNYSKGFAYAKDPNAVYSGHKCMFATTSKCPSGCVKKSKGSVGTLLPDSTISAKYYNGCYIKKGNQSSIVIIYIHWV